MIHEQLIIKISRKCGAVKISMAINLCSGDTGKIENINSTNQYQRCKLFFQSSSIFALQNYSIENYLACFRTIVIILNPQLLRCSLCKDSNIRSFDENEFCSVILSALHPNYISLLLENWSKVRDELLPISAFQYTLIIFPNNWKFFFFLVEVKIQLSKI